VGVGTSGSTSTSEIHNVYAASSVEDGSRWFVAFRTPILERGPPVPGLAGPLPKTEESAMGVAKKAKHGAKSLKGKTKKDAGKVKHKGKKAKNAAKH
jgi:hypothetical protein